MKSSVDYSTVGIVFYTDIIYFIELWIIRQSLLKTNIYKVNNLFQYYHRCATEACVCSDFKSFIWLPTNICKRSCHKKKRENKFNVIKEKVTSLSNVSMTLTLSGSLLISNSQIQTRSAANQLILNIYNSEENRKPMKN